MFILLQVAAVYRDPSVGNLINIMIVKLVVIHNEQVRTDTGAAVSEYSETAGISHTCTLSLSVALQKDTALLVRGKPQVKSPQRKIYYCYVLLPQL